jgi:hypothetical protein
MATNADVPTASGLRWSQDACLDLLGTRESFRWAQSVALDHGGDDDQWMAMIRKGLPAGARVGHLGVGNGVVAYGELLGAPAGMLGSPKRNQPRWTWHARRGQITNVDYQPFVTGRFGPYSVVTIATQHGRQRFGIDFSNDADSLVCAIRDVAGEHRPFNGPATANVRSDGAYVAARKKSDTWQVLIYNAERNQFVLFGGRPHLCWKRAVEEPDELKWHDVVERPDGILDYGTSPTQFVPLADGAITTDPTWTTTPLSSAEYIEWDFVPVDELLDVKPMARLSPTPGKAVMNGATLSVEGYAPHQSAEEFEARNQAHGPYPSLAYIESALDDSVERSGGFFKKSFYLTYVRDSVDWRLRDGERCDLAMPVVVEAGSSSAPAGDGATRVKPTGRLHPGLMVTLDDRFILAWTEGSIKMTPNSLELPYADIRQINKFEMSVKMSKLPAFEILTPNQRIVATFTNHPDCNANFEWWRDRLTSRLSGWKPVFDGVKLVRWEAPNVTG